MSAARQFGTIRKLPSGRFQARYSHLGKQVGAKDTFATKTDARRWLSTVETDLARGDHFDESAGRMRFSVYALAKVYRLFRTIMETAVEDGLIRSNPVKLKGAATEKVHRRPEVTFKDVVRLAEVIEPAFSALVWTAATSGLRYGEPTALRRCDVNLEVGQVDVKKSLSFERGTGPVFGPPKTESGERTVSLDPTTLAILRKHVQVFTEAGADALVFRSVKGSPLLNRYFHPSWERAKRDAEANPDIRFHDLRHLAGTTAASAGASTKEIMAVRGHVKVLAGGQEKSSRW